MINAVKEFPYVAFQDKTRIRTIFTHRAKHLCQIFNAFMRALTDSARKRGRNEDRLKKWIQNSKKCVVEHSISHRRFVYMSPLRVANVKARIRSMPICFVSQFPLQFKNMLFEILLKSQNIRLPTLIAPEFVPRQKQVFCTGDFIE